METKPWAIGLIILTTLLTTTGQFLWKKGADLLVEFTVLSLVTNIWIWLGFVMYGLATVLLILGLRGGELSVLYPIVATSYVWVTLLSPIVLGEPLTVLKIVGVLVIVVGISFIGVGAKNGRNHVA